MDNVLEILKHYESPNVTFIEPDGSWPIVWEKARGVHVWDANGKKYLDLTAAFGVAAAGHANRKVVAAGQAQMERLLHAMGDVHPHAQKARLARELSLLTFERWEDLFPARYPADARAATGKTIFCSSGFEAVEAALKTALLATGKPGVIAFEGAYHGLGYGALNATHRRHFRAPFKTQLGEFGVFAPYPTTGAQSRSCRTRPTQQPARKLREAHGSRDDGAAALRTVERVLSKHFSSKKIGAILVEPIQGRGGIRIPGIEFLEMLRNLCTEHGALLIVDEIYTGFGRTGEWFACEHSAVVPDIICLGKALTGGFPLSACVGRADILDAAWPRSDGEAIHTSTFLGHPVGCAMALAQIQEIRAGNLVRRSAAIGKWLLGELQALEGESNGLIRRARGLGLMAGLELTTTDGKPATSAALAAIKKMLHAGFIMLPEGEFSNVLTFSPPLTITEAQLRTAIKTLTNVLGR